MTQKIRIGIDVMGSDTPPEELLRAVLLFSEEVKEKVSFSVFATPPVLATAVASHAECIQVSDTIEMGDDPLVALRMKKDSSLVRGLKMLKNREIDAFVSAGNTGALMACAKIFLPMLQGIDRPALLTLLPTKLQPVAVLDVGANLTCNADQLIQFAKMGLGFQMSRGIALPRVGLLNIGSEEKKGTPVLREAYSALLQLGEKEGIFIGNIEGREVFQGKVDVLVTDGFTGNVFLKTGEGIAAFILDRLNNTAAFRSIPEVKEAVDQLGQLLHYAEYPGAILCGIDSVVVKCHGHSNEYAFINGIRGAIRLLEQHFLENIKRQLGPNHI